MQWNPITDRYSPEERRKAKKQHKLRKLTRKEVDYIIKHPVLSSTQLRNRLNIIDIPLKRFQNRVWWIRNKSHKHEANKI